MSTPLSFTLNGEARAIELIGKPSALDLLRDSLGLTSLKGGCAPQGVCGCCVALVNGKPRLTCTLPAKTLQGKEVLTQEGLPAEAAAAFAHAFATCGGSQCGYCTPGIVMSGYARPARSEPRAQRGRAQRRSAGPPLPLHRHGDDPRQPARGRPPAPGRPTRGAAPPRAARPAALCR